MFSEKNFDTWKEDFKVWFEDTERYFSAGKLSSKEFADVLRAGVSEIEEDIKRLKTLLLYQQKHTPKNLERESDLKRHIKEFTALLGRYDGLIAELEQIDKGRGYS